MEVLWNLCKVRSKTAVLNEYCSQSYHPRRLCQQESWHDTCLSVCLSWELVDLHPRVTCLYLIRGNGGIKRSDCGDTSLLRGSSLGYKLIKKGGPVLPRVVPSARSVSFVRRICFHPRRLLNFHSPDFWTKMFTNLLLFSFPKRSLVFLQPDFVI